MTIRTGVGAIWALHQGATGHQVHGSVQTPLQMDEISMSTEPKIYDPADVERATCHALPRVRHLAWALVDREGVIELRIASVEPVRQWDPVRIPAAWIEHIKQLVVEALDKGISQ